MQTPNVEYRAPTQSMHPVASKFGPVPAPQAEHVVRFAFTTFGASHDAQACPNAENVVPVHETHDVRSVFGASPGAQLAHV